MPMKEQVKYQITFQTRADEDQYQRRPQDRIQAMLKRSGRAWGLKAVEVILVSST